MNNVNESAEDATESKRAGRSTQWAVMIAAAALVVGGLVGWTSGTLATRTSGAPDVTPPGGVVFLDVFVTEDGETDYKATLGLLTQPGEAIDAVTKDSPRFNFVVCEEKEGSVSPCGPEGPAADEFGAVSVRWDAEGRVVGAWQPPSGRAAGP